MILRGVFSFLRALDGAILELLCPPRARCAGCGSLVGTDEGCFCSNCVSFTARECDCVVWNHPAGVRDVYAPYRYAFPVSGAVRAFKFRSDAAAGDFMARQMTALVNELYLPKPDAVVAVPLHWRRKLERGFNQSDVLAKAVARCWDMKPAKLLRRTRYTRKQSLTKSAKRRANTKNAFAAVSRCDGMRILLVDDVITSGSTGNDCARALREAGALSVDLIACCDASGRRDRL